MNPKDFLSAVHWAFQRETREATETSDGETLESAAGTSITARDSAIDSSPLRSPAYDMLNLLTIYYIAKTSKKFGHLNAEDLAK